MRDGDPDESTLEVARRLLAVQEQAGLIDPLTAEDGDFDQAQAHRVLDAIAGIRREQGWRSVGRKIGFTNRTVWEVFGVDGPIWAHLWDHTVIDLPDGRAELALAPYVQPRIEPEVVVKLAGPVPADADPVQVLERVEWLAAGFELVHCHYADWRITAADAVADFGLHGALFVGPPLAVDGGNRSELADVLTSFEATLSCDGEVRARGVGANVLGSPAHAVADLARTLHADGQAPLAAGEVLTTGTITDAQPVVAGQTWTSDYGALGLRGLAVTFS